MSNFHTIAVINKFFQPQPAPAKGHTKRALTRGFSMIITCGIGFGLTSFSTSATLIGPIEIPSSTGGLATGQVYNLVDDQGTMCLDVTSSNFAGGTNVQRYSCNFTGAQKWKLIDSGDSSYPYKFQADGGDSNYCLDADINGQNIQIVQCNSHNAQKWKAILTGNGMWRLENKHYNGRCLDSGGSGGNVYTGSNCNDNAHRRWTFLQSSETSLYGTSLFLTDQNAAMCLDVESSNFANGTNIQRHQCNATAAQQWKMVYSGDNDYPYQLKVASNDSYCLNADTGGNNVKLQSCNDHDAQKWSVTDEGNGFYKLNNKHGGGGNCLDSGGASNNVYTGAGCNSNSHRLWTIARTVALQPGDKYFLTPKDNLLDCLDGGGSNDRVYRYTTCENGGSNAQKWQLETNGNFYRLRSVGESNKCLQLNAQSEATIVQCNSGQHAQDWSLKQTTDGKFTIENRNTTQCLNAVSGNYANGVTCGSSNNNLVWQFTAVDMQKQKPRWMASVPAERKLSQLAIPGTHDSASWSGVDVYERDGLGHLATESQYITQNASSKILNQLRNGVRFLDIRYRYYPDVTLFRLKHGKIIFGTTIHNEVLKDVKLFLTNNPTETVLMSLQGDIKSGTETDARAAFKTQILDQYPSLFVSSTNWNNLSLKDIRGKVVMIEKGGSPTDIVTGHSGQSNLAMPYSQFDNKQDDYELSGDSFCDDWSDNSKDEKIQTALDNALSNYGDSGYYSISFLSSYSSVSGIPTCIEAYAGTANKFVRERFDGTVDDAGTTIGKGINLRGKKIGSIFPMDFVSNTEGVKNTEEIIISNNHDDWKKQ